MDRQECEHWYNDNKQKYGDLTKSINEELHRIFESEGVKKGKDYLFIDARLKCRKSFLEKMLKMDEKDARAYTNPDELTDITGARIVGYILSDVSTLCTLIERYFDMDMNRSVKQSQRLGDDRVGYRSFNYVAYVGETTLKRTNLSKRFKGLYFEIQVKTLLDFAWQEIEHDRVYKTSAEFPPESRIRRKFNLISGLLEVADDNFEGASKEAEIYDKNLADKISAGELEDLNISARSLRLYLQGFKDVPGITPYFAVSDQVLKEIDSMGISRISQLDKIIRSDFKARYIKVSTPKDTVTYTAILRDILIIYDAKRYTKYAYRPHYYETLDYHASKVHKEFGVNRDDLPADVDYMEGSG